MLGLHLNTFKLHISVCFDILITKDVKKLTYLFSNTKVLNVKK